MAETERNPTVEAQNQQNLSQAQAMAPSYSERREYLLEMIEDDLDPGTVGMLRNMTSRDFILSNFGEAEINEIKKLREITLKKVVAAHPNKDSIMQGDLREQIYESGEPLTPLTPNQKVLIDQFLRGAFARLSRSKDGFQQDQFGKTISASETRTPDDDSNGGIMPW